ncbi:MAG: hypothetical protein JSW59_01290 [Phycisphaerales bacterium]|nr:MAG: hypothetical protein JSW59_01290 [Phycisphaerales bacterium]
MTQPFECEVLLADLGFELWFSLRKERARLWEIPEHHFNRRILKDTLSILWRELELTRFVLDLGTYNCYN